MKVVNYKGMAAEKKLNSLRSQPLAKSQHAFFLVEISMLKFKWNLKCAIRMQRTQNGQNIPGEETV
jgi:hypothetical protein